MMMEPKMIPNAPVPPLEHTLARYLEYAEVLAASHDPTLSRLEPIDEVRLAVDEFKKEGGVGKQIQAKLESLAEEKARVGECWVNGFWLPEMYLQQRYSLVWNSNPAYVFPRQRFNSLAEQLDYAARLVHAFMEFKEEIDSNHLTTEFTRDGIPLCMEQYHRLFSTYRVPHPTVDSHYCKAGYNPTTITTSSNNNPSQLFNTTITTTFPPLDAPRRRSSLANRDGEKSFKNPIDYPHILVMRQGQCFVASVGKKREPPTNGTTIVADGAGGGGGDDDYELCSPSEIRAQLQRICTMAASRGGGTITTPVGWATAGRRETAARFWESAATVACNRQSLRLAMDAVFTLCLDESEDQGGDDGNGGGGGRGGCGEKVDSGSNISMGRRERDGLQLLCGGGGSPSEMSGNTGNNGGNRWYDSTLQLVVGRSGCCGLCIEHSVAEGIVIIRMVEEAFRRIATPAPTSTTTTPLAPQSSTQFANSKPKYTVIMKPSSKLLPTIEDGTSNTTSSKFMGASTSQPQSLLSKPANSASASSSWPRPLVWALSEEALAILEECRRGGLPLAKAIHSRRSDGGEIEAQLALVEFPDYGKEAIKRWRLSPDGFVQLAMQLAHFSLHGYAVSTYESATLRRFHHGRVDNIRAASRAALKWAEAMRSEGPECIEWAAAATGKAGEEGENEGEEGGKREKLKGLLYAAAEEQAEITRENVSGWGIDNHLCALEVLSRSHHHLGNSPCPPPRIFTQTMWRELMRFPLSTSQVSVSEEQAARGTYLCYGPVVEDGYGCAYGIYANKIVFAASAYRSNPRTDLDGFRRELTLALQAMRELCEDK